MAITAQSPRLMVGVPTGYLSPQIPPPATGHVAAVGIEIEPGLGISLDGKALLVGPKDAFEKQDIVGHLDGGTYPNRDFQVLRQGGQTTVNGYYDNQDYKLQQSGNRVDVKGQTDREDYSAIFRPDGIDVKSKWAARSYTVNVDGANASVKSDYADGIQYQLKQEGNTTRVSTGIPEADFTFTRQGDGSIVIDGNLKPQDFTIGRQDGALVVQGYYPQQKFVVKNAA